MQCLERGKEVEPREQQSWSRGFEPKWRRQRPPSPEERPTERNTGKNIGGSAEGSTEQEGLKESLKERLQEITGRQSLGVIGGITERIKENNLEGIAERMVGLVGTKPPQSRRAPIY